LAQVLAASQQEYLDNLKKSRDAVDDTAIKEGSSSQQQQQRDPALELQQGRSDNASAEGGETSNDASGSNNNS